MIDTKTIIIELAKEINKEHAIDFGMISVNEDDVYNLLATSLMEQYNTTIKDLTSEEKDTVYLSTMLQLLVENFMLYQHMMLNAGSTDVSTILKNINQRRK